MYRAYGALKKFFQKIPFLEKMGPENHFGAILEQLKVKKASQKAPKTRPKTVTKTEPKKTPKKELKINLFWQGTGSALILGES